MFSSLLELADPKPPSIDEMLRLISRAAVDAVEVGRHIVKSGSWGCSVSGSTSGPGGS